LTMTIVATLAGAIFMLGNFAFFLGGNRENGNGIIGVISTILAMIVAPFAAMIVQMAVSRTREYAADRRGAEICGNPLWLSSALGKIARGAKSVVNEEAEHNPATAHMFIINPLSGRGADNLFSTHPDTDNRIQALEQMAAEMGIRSAGMAQRNTAPAQNSGPWGQTSGNADKNNSGGSGSNSGYRGPWS